MSTSHLTMTNDPILTAGDRDSELAAIVALMRTGAVGPAYGISALVDQVGSAVTLLQMLLDGTMTSGQQSLLAAVPQDEIGRALHDVQEWLAAGIDVRSILDADYPSNLHGIFNRPPLLFVRGRWQSEVDARAVAVVGTRKPTEDGKKRAQRVAHALVRAGYTVLSGLAAGIDAAAHAAALEVGGRTCAVMGTGIHRIYPAQNRRLAEEILASGGALLSQFFPDQPPTKWTFPYRNVVMSGLALATVVIEAAETSGARMQARFALEHGRTVFLPNSLVEEHDWAQRYSTEGMYGTRAIKVTSAEEIIERLHGASLDGAAAR